MPLFDLESVPITLLNQQGRMTYWDNFFSEPEASQLFNELFANSNWQEEEIALYGKRYQQPRLTCWYGDFGVKADGGYQIKTNAMPIIGL